MPPPQIPIHGLGAIFWVSGLLACYSKYLERLRSVQDEVPQ